jgi:hypothetical protein
MLNTLLWLLLITASAMLILITGLFITEIDRQTRTAEPLRRGAEETELYQPTITKLSMLEYRRLCRAGTRRRTGYTFAR